jgi:putative endonuclease
MNRARAERNGRWAESLAAAYLRAKGYQILARRARTPVGEIDIVARHHDTLVFVEVKLRRTLDSGHQALHRGQRRRIDAAARVLTPRYLGRCTTTRIDAILMRPWSWPEHLVAAWREM